MQLQRVFTRIRRTQIATLALIAFVGTCLTPSFALAHSVKATRDHARAQVKQRIQNAETSRNTPATGTPTLKSWTPALPNAASNTGPKPSSLLDEVGRFAQAIAPGQAERWKAVLKRSVVPVRERAQIHLWLGEWELAGAQDPERALWHFRQVKRLISKTEPLHGLAAYDAAVAVYYQGAYREAQEAFTRLLDPKTALPGYDTRRVALWKRHAAACVGYHDERARAGITEPERLDPLCGASSLAICLKGLKLPYDKKTVLGAIKVTGRGSSLADILAASDKLKLSSRAITLDEKGLKALPKPVIAFVEHDHWLTVVEANDRGVAYFCSECGPWPGGRRELTWKQWRMMEAGPYVTVYRKGSVADRALEEALASDGRSRGKKSASTGAGSEFRVATTSGLAGLRLTTLGQFSTLSTLLKGHVLAYTPLLYGNECGDRPEGMHCPPDVICPLDGDGCMLGGKGSGKGKPGGDWGSMPGTVGRSGGGPLRVAGPSFGDPVNLATGEEEYAPEPDLHVYNPAGAAITWGRLFNSMRGYDATYPSDDFGIGWSHPYNVLVYDPNTPLLPQLAQGGSLSTPFTGFDGPGTGLEWDIVRNGSTVASSDTPNGWSVSFDFSNLNVTAPATATNGIGYRVRYYIDFYDWRVSADFDVSGAGELPRGSRLRLAPSPCSPAANSMRWEIRRNGTVIGTSARPRGWEVEYEAFAGTLDVTVPMLADLGSGYEVRASHPEYAEGYAGSTFSVIAHRFNPRSGSKYVIWPNGARTEFIAPSVPTSVQPQIVCTSSPGAPLRVTWNYSASDPLGTFTVTFNDSSRWELGGSGKGVNGGAICHSLLQEVAGTGTALSFQYSGVGDSGFPLLSAIKRADTGATLLALNRASDGSGNLLSVADAYNRSVYYHVGSYATDGIPYWNRQSVQELDQVSQIVTTGTSNPPLRWEYGYVLAGNGHGTQWFPNLHTITVPSPTGTGTKTSTLNYGSDGRITNVVDANGNKREYTAVDANHTQVTVKTGAGVTVYSYTVGFDSNMSLTTVTDGTNTTVVQTNTYGDANNPYGPSEVTDGNNRTTTLTWDQWGNLQTETSPRSVQTTYTWDYSVFPLGRLESVQEGTKTATTFQYYEPSGLVQAVTSPRPGTSGGTTVTTSYTYDSLGNILTVTRPGNNAAATVTTTLNYTNDGAYSQAAAVGQPLTVTDPLGHTTHLRYDARGNLVLVADAVGNQTDLTYNLADQRVQTEVPPTGQSGPGRSTVVNGYLYPAGPLVTQTAYNESGTQVRQVTQSLGAEGELLSVTGSTEPVAYVYDAAYRLKELRDGRNSATLYSYNASGYLASVNYPGGDSVQYPAYNAVGQVLQRIDGRNWTTNYTYNDVENRLTAVQYPGTPALNVALTYDGYGRLGTVTDGSGSHTYTYDDRNSRTSTTTTYTGLPGKTLAYSFHPDGSRESLTTPAGTFNYTYDAAGRMTGLSNPFAETTSWQYLNNDWLWKQTLANGVTTAYAYNGKGLPLSVESRDSGNTRLSWYGNLVYDGVGNRTALTADLPGTPAYNGQTGYSYDTKDQLLQEQSTRAGGYTSNFGYDGAGNPTTFKGAGHTYNLNNQNTAYTYDGNGNPTVYRGTACGYDPENRLTSVGGLLTAGYRVDGKRAWKQTAAGRTYFLYDGLTPVVELDATGAVSATHTIGAAGLISRRSGGSSVFYTFDPHGSVAQRLDGTGSVLTSHVWDVHGAGQVTGSFSDPFGYGAQWGYYTDQETGLLLLSLRYYDPVSGRFLTRDPISYDGGVNLYAYTGNNPANAIDPDGTRWTIGQYVNFVKAIVDKDWDTVILLLEITTGTELPNEIVVRVLQNPRNLR